MAISCLHERVVVVVGGDVASWWCWGQVSIVFEVAEVELGGWWWCGMCRRHVRSGGGGAGWWWCWGRVCVVFEEVVVVVVTLS